MCSKIRLAGVLALPLALGACGMPIGIQIASLFADSVSYLTTEKTLTDHGISAVTDKDCALWRGIEGEDICRDPDSQPADEGVQTALAEVDAAAAPDRPAEMTAGDADLPEALAQPAWTSPQPTAAEPRRVETRIAVLGKETHKGLGAAAEPAEPAESESLILGTAIPKRDTAVKRVELAAAAPVPAAPVPPAAPVIAVKADLPPDVAQSPAPPAKTPAPGSSYVIIASYYRAEDAARFSKRNAKWKPQVLEGRAKDRQVFRVAVGPLARMTAGKQAKQFRKEGFKGAWRLTLEKPIVETEMAALR